MKKQSILRININTNDKIIELKLTEVVLITITSVESKDTAATERAKPKINIFLPCNLFLFIIFFPTKIRIKQNKNHITFNIMFDIENIFLIINLFKMTTV